MPYGLYSLNVRLFEEPSSHVSLKLARYAEIIGQFPWVAEVVIDFAISLW